jgi:predicted RNase H-like HicB family nuclease
MKLRAIIKKTDDWWIGWLVDIPGVNAQEKTKEKLLESLRIGAEDMLTADVSVEPGAQIEMLDIPLSG